MVDVARAAGCSRATLYRYFPNQEALVVLEEALALLGEVGDDGRVLAGGQPQAHLGAGHRDQGIDGLRDSRGINGEYRDGRLLPRHFDGLQD